MPKLETFPSREGRGIENYVIPPLCEFSLPTAILHWRPEHLRPLLRGKQPLSQCRPELVLNGSQHFHQVYGRGSLVLAERGTALESFSVVTSGSSNSILATASTRYAERETAASNIHERESPSISASHTSSARYAERDPTDVRERETVSVWASDGGLGDSLLLPSAATYLQPGQQGLYVRSHQLNPTSVLGATAVDAENSESSAASPTSSSFTAVLSATTSDAFRSSESSAASMTSSSFTAVLSATTANAFRSSESSAASMTSSSFAAADSEGSQSLRFHSQGGFGEGENEAEEETFVEGGEELWGEGEVFVWTPAAEPVSRPLVPPFRGRRLFSV